ncbi:ABC transporter ATP-binding protein [Streptococcus fryi]
MKIVRDLWWFFRLEKRRYLIGIVALVLVSLLNLIPPMIMGKVIDQITSGQLRREALLWRLLALVITAFAMYALRYVWRMYILATSHRLGKIMRSRLFEHFTKMSPSFYQRYRTGDLMAHATNDINALVRLSGGGVMSFVDATITALVTLVTMFVMISWQMTLVAIIPLPLMALTTSYLGRQTHERLKVSQAAFSDLNNKVQESVAGIKVTKSFGYQQEELSSFQEVNQATYEKNVATMFFDAMFSPVVLLFVGTSYVLTLLVGSYFIKMGQVTLGNLVTFMTYLDMLVWPLMAMGFLFNMSQRGTVSYNRISQLLAEQSDVIETEHPVTDVRNGDLVFDIDRFSYDNSETLKDIHFTLTKGQTLGLVGQTGSGKTTLLKLLLREYDVADGQITLNGANIKDYRLSDLRQLIGYVPQDQFLFARSILENVRFGNPNLTEEAVVEVSKLAQVYEDIMDMPEQFETVVGEKGVSLSGGQKQRLAIGRAMILNPDILILDDSLSAVDAKTEHAIITNLKQNRQGKTTLITAHRLSAVVHADLILVLQNGRIIERGTHDELIASEGWYQKTYLAQQLEMEELND